MLRLIFCFLAFAAVQTIAMGHESQDTIVSVEPNFGILKIKPVYSYNMGRMAPWNLTINNEDYFLFETEVYETRPFETKFRPNKYKIKLTHECYEDIIFDIDIERDKSVDFDISGEIKPKMGTLILNATLKGKPVTEPVFVNGELAGETPLNKEVPICSEIRISEYRKRVNVKPEYKEEARYTHIIEPPFVFSMNFSLFPLSTTSSYYSYDNSSSSYTEKKSQKSGINLIVGFDVVNPANLLGAGAFIGGGWLGGTATEFYSSEFIFGFEVKKVFWPFKQIAIPISLGIGGRIQMAEMDNGLIATFIDEPKFLQEPEYFFYQQRDIDRMNLDIMPSIDLQFTIPARGDTWSLYIGYMYRITFSSDWQFDYKIPGKYYGNSNGSTYSVPEEYNPLKNAKESILGIPGTLRIGFKVH